MTIDERAEKIIRGIYPFDTCPPEWKSIIAAEIRAAVEEALQTHCGWCKGKDHTYCYRCHCHSKNEQIEKIARADEREACAKALNALYVMKGSENDGMVFIPTAQELIRSRSKEG